MRSTHLARSYKELGGGGGGVANRGGQVSITNSTIKDNQAIRAPSGIWNSGGTLKIQNTIVAGNTVEDPPCGPVTASDCVGTITSLGNNVVGEPTPGCNIKFQPSDLMGDPGLGALVGTGEDDLPGRAFYPVLLGSPVIDRGDPSACLQTDQLRNPRRASVISERLNLEDRC